MASGCQKTDLVQSRLCWLLWGIPTVLLLAGAILPTARAWLWVPAFAVAGAACLANARRCGRIHCFITGPLYLLLAAAVLLGSLDLLAIDAGWIALLAIVGTIAAYVPEWLRGRYITMTLGNRT